MGTNRSFTKGLGLVAAAGAAAFGWSLLEARMYTLREFTVPVLPAGSSELRLLHVSDLHLTPARTELAAWVRDLSSLQPDLVINTGDNIAHRDALPTLLTALEPLLELPGAFVLGSNDYFEPVLKNPAAYLRRPTIRPAGGSSTEAESEPNRLPTADLRGYLSMGGWLDLSNSRGNLQHDGLGIELVGVDDPHLGWDRYPEQVAKKSGALRLGVTHAPYRRVLDVMVDDDVDLILAGHTHGGQLAVPGFGALVTNCDIDTKRAKGLHGWPGARPTLDPNSAWLHVSAGLGTSPYTPVRFACRPEASLLRLVPVSA